MSTLIGVSSRVRAGMVAFALLVPGSAVLVSATPAGAHAPAHWCQCVDYIKHVYGITGATGNAKDMGSALTGRYGFKRLSSPVSGAVVIFQPSFPGADRTYGHVGIIQSVADRGSQWQLRVRGANQGGNQRISNCTNVNDVTFSSYGKGSGLVSYYRR